MTPEEHVASVEQAIAQGFQRKIGNLKSELKEAQERLKEATAELDEARSQKAVVVEQTTRELARARTIMADTVGGNWMDLLLVIGSIAGGITLGYYIQRAVDLRAPWVAIGGLTIVGVGLIKRDWQGPARSGTVALGASLAAGAVVFTMTMGDDDVPVAGAGVAA